MSVNEQAVSTRHFAVYRDLLSIPDLDIYSQMACIILQAYANDAVAPTLAQIARDGRMTTKQASRALQKMVDAKLISQKAFKEIIGEFGDDRLSWAAKGILVFIKRNPETTFKDLLQLAEQSGEDERSIRLAWAQLERHGYLQAETGENRVKA